MGRRPKYLTAEDKAKAAIDRKQRYASSAHGKAVRSEQNRRAYQKRQQEAKCKDKMEPGFPCVDEEPTITPLTLPTIPNLLIKHAEEPLPLRSEHYRKELRSRGEIPDTDSYTYWDHPPYKNPQKYITQLGFVAHSEAVDGRRRRRQREHEAQRLARYESSTDGEILKEIHDDIVKTLEEWSCLRVVLAESRPTSSMISKSMGNYLLYHKARLVIDLVEDWHAVKKGRDEYGLAVVYSNRW